jgi:uncharacterized LabA/DUF88 family protein
MIFIDGPNFYHGLARDFKKSACDINFALLSNLVTHNNRSLVRAYFYDSHASGPDSPSADAKSSKISVTDRKALHEKIHNIANYELKMPDVDHNQQAIREPVDLRLAVDLIRYAAMRLYDVAVLITSDEDFVPAIKAVKEFGLQVELLHFEETKQRLVNISDRRRVFDQHLIDALARP